MYSSTVKCKVRLSTHSNWTLIKLSLRLTDKLEEYHKKEDELHERYGREMEAKTKLQKVLRYREH